MKKIFETLAAISLIISLACGTVCAAELTGTVMNAYTGPDSLTLFVKGQGRDIDHVYVGSDEAKSFSQGEAGPLRTVVLIDNSLSIPAQNREDIKSLLTELVAAREDGELFTIATFAQQLSWLVQESSDYLDIKSKIDSLEFVDQDSYLTNSLYELMTYIASCEELRYTRVLVVADGAENEALGYTDDELYKKIQAVQVPIYAIGCSTGGNEENLKKMFAVSRHSNARSYLLGETGVMDILRDIALDKDVLKVEIVPPDAACDGSAKVVRVAFGDDYCTAELAMPFKAADIPEPSQPVPTPAPTPSVQPEPVPEEKEELPLLWIIVGAALLLIIIAVVAVLLVNKRRDKRASALKESDPTDIKQSGGQDVSGQGKTEIFVDRNSGEGPEDDSRTDVFNDSRRTIRLHLQDINDPNRTFEQPVRDKIYIGKDSGKCQIVVDYNKYISSVHCTVISRRDGLYVQDGGMSVVSSTNGTFVNEKRAAPEQPLPVGSILKLGPVSFKVSYR